MSTIPIAICITILAAVITATWRLAVYIRRVELQITNHLRHDVERIEDKIDKIEEVVYEIKGKISKS